jgi:hypothetical protein
MKRRIAQLLKIAGIAIPVLGLLSLVRWHPAWAIWITVAFFAFNGLLVVILAIGWTILARRAARAASETTDDNAMVVKAEETTLQYGTVINMTDTEREQIARLPIDRCNYQQVRVALDQIRRQNSDNATN